MFISLEKWKESTLFLWRSSVLWLITLYSYPCQPSRFSSGVISSRSHPSTSARVQDPSLGLQNSLSVPHQSSPRAVYGPVSSENSKFPEDMLCGLFLLVPLVSSTVCRTKKALIKYFCNWILKTKALLYVKIQWKKWSYTRSNTNRKDLGIQSIYWSL